MIHGSHTGPARHARRAAGANACAGCCRLVRSRRATSRRRPRDSRGRRLSEGGDAPRGSRATSRARSLRRARSPRRRRIRRWPRVVADVRVQQDVGIRALRARPCFARLASFAHHSAGAPAGVCVLLMLRDVDRDHDARAPSPRCADRHRARFVAVDRISRRRCATARSCPGSLREARHRQPRVSPRLKSTSSPSLRARGDGDERRLFRRSMGHAGHARVHEVLDGAARRRASRDEATLRRTPATLSSRASCSSVSGASHTRRRRARPPWRRRSSRPRGRAGCPRLPAP